MRFRGTTPIFCTLAAAGLLAACAAQPAGRPTSEAPTQARLAPQPLPPAPALESLTGVGPEVVRSALGSPAFKRTEPGAEIWQYGAGGCRLFVYFYEQADGLASAHLDARRPAGGPSDLQACVAEVAQAVPTGAIAR